MRVVAETAARIATDRASNARAWALWTLAASLPALLTRNPVYLIVALLVVAVVHTQMDSHHQSLPVWRLGLIVITVATLWNALTAHFGATIIFTLPKSLPLIGGIITLEAIIFGLANGLAIWLLFAAFATFSAIVTPYEILSLVPHTLRHAGLIVTIALTFFPQVLRTAQQLNEAQTIRGYRARHIRDLTAMFVPLLLNNLENATQLAAAMETRGYGRTTNRGQHAGIGWLGLLLGVLVQLYWRDAIVGWIVIASAVGWLLLSQRGAIQITRYRREHWSRVDSFIALASGVMLLVVTSNPFALAYTPYPRLTLPPIDAPILLAILILLAPALTLEIEKSHS